MHTIWAITDKGSPSSLSRFDQADLDLDLAHRVITLGGIDLTFERLEDESFVSMREGELVRHSSRSASFSLKWRLVVIAYLPGLKDDLYLLRIGALIEDGQGDLLVSFVEFMSGLQIPGCICIRPRMFGGSAETYLGVVMVVYAP